MQILVNALIVDINGKPVLSCLMIPKRCVTEELKLLLAEGKEFEHHTQYDVSTSNSDKKIPLYVLDNP